MSALLSGLENSSPSLPKLRAIVHILRSEKGCPWDKRQTAHSLIRYLTEESAELADALASGDERHICEELGDMFFILSLLLEIHEERQLFNEEDVFQQICEKMVRRHPHVFAGAPMEDEEVLRAQWIAIKNEEKKQQNADR